MLTPLETDTIVPDTVPTVTELPNNVRGRGRGRSSRDKPSDDVPFEGPGLSLISRRTRGGKRSRIPTSIQNENIQTTIQDEPIPTHLNRAERLDKRRKTNIAT